MNIDSGYDIKAHKPAPYILTSPRLWLGHEYIIAMNKSVWESLSESDRQAFIRAADSSYKVLGGIMDESFAWQVKTLSEDGSTVRLMTDDEVSYWEHATNYEAVQDKWIDGDAQAAEVLKTLRRLINN